MSCICTHPPDVATLDQRNVARAVVVVLGNKKKLEAGFVATFMAAVVSGQKAPVTFSKWCTNGFEASTAERANGGRHDGRKT